MECGDVVFDESEMAHGPLALVARLGFDHGQDFVFEAPGFEPATNPGAQVEHRAWRFGWV